VVDSEIKRHYLVQCSAVGVLLQTSVLPQCSRYAMNFYKKLHICILQLFT
jgi:hypothetical protein